MNNNKVNVITNDLANTKNYVPIGNINITDDLTIDKLVTIVFNLSKELELVKQNLTTYKETVKEAISLLQAKFDDLSKAIETNKVSVTAEINNIKESIKLLGGVL